MEKTPNAPPKAIKLLGKQVNLWPRYEWGTKQNPAEQNSFPFSYPPLDQLKSGLFALPLLGIVRRSLNLWVWNLYSDLLNVFQRSLECELLF